MLDYVAYQMAQQQVAEVARGALPDSPARLSRDVSHSVFSQTSERLRTAAAGFLRRIAARCDAPVPAGPQPAQDTANPRGAMSYRPRRPALDGIDA